MRRTATIAGSVIAALAAGGALAVSGGAADSPAGQTLKYVSKNCAFHFSDVPPRARSQAAGPGAGDGITISCRVFDGAGTRVGTIDAVATFTGGGKSARAVATGVYHLPSGNIYLAARFVGEGSTTTGVVTGGDGAYVGARGTFSSVDRPGKGNVPSDDTITLLP